MTPAEILEFIEKAKSLGLKSIEIEGVKVEFNDLSQAKESRQDSNNQEELDADALVSKQLDDLTDEEILFWSSSYGEELEAKRKQDQLDAIQRKKEDQERI